MIEMEELATFLEGDVVAKHVIRCPYPGKGEYDRSVTVTVNPDSLTIETVGDAQACADHITGKIVAALMSDTTDDEEAI
jgi:hypothetical protein